MLEIFLIIAISKKIAAMMNEKGRSAAGFVVLFIFMWFGGELIGAVIGTIVTIANNPNAVNDGFNFMAYIVALVGAAIGGGIGYAIAASMPPVVQMRPVEIDDEEDDYERERRRRRREADEGAFEDGGGRKKTNDDGSFEGRAGH